MLELELSYNNDTINLFEFLAFKYPQFKLEAFNSDNLEEVKDAKRIQNYWATEKTPFLIISDNGQPKKGFYEESNECNIKTIDNWINTYLSENEK